MEEVRSLGMLCRTGMKGNQNLDDGTFEVLRGMTALRDLDLSECQGITQKAFQQFVGEKGLKSWGFDRQKTKTTHYFS